MIQGIIILLVFIFLFYVFEIFQNITLVKILSIFFGFFIFYILLFNVTDNSDWENYEAIFNGYTQSKDVLFNLISAYFAANGYEYQIVYKVHIFLMCTSFIFIITRFSTHHVFTVISVYLLLQLIPLSNQIRYFVAFSFFLISAYELIFSKSIILFLIFSLLSILSHTGVLLMFPFIYIYYRINIENYLRKLILFSMIFSILVFVVYKIALWLFSQYTPYFETDLLSSVRGGIFNNLVLVLWILYVFFRNKSLLRLKQSEITEDTKYQFLYKLSLYPIIFIPTGTILQIISHRYVAASIIIWVIYILYSMKYNDKVKDRFVQLSLFLSLVIVSFIYIYLLPEFLFGTSNIMAVLDLFNSNKFFTVYE